MISTAGQDREDVWMPKSPGAPGDIILNGTYPEVRGLCVLKSDIRGHLNAGYAPKLGRDTQEKISVKVESYSFYPKAPFHLRWRASGFRPSDRAYLYLSALKFDLHFFGFMFLQTEIRWS